MRSGGGRGVAAPPPHPAGRATSSGHFTTFVRWQGGPPGAWAAVLKTTNGPGGRLLCLRWMNQTVCCLLEPEGIFFENHTRLVLSQRKNADIYT